MRELDLDGLRAALLRAVLDGDTIHDMFQDIYALLRLPLNAFDVSFSLIANAFPRPFYFDAWERMAVAERAATADIVADNYLEYQEAMYAHGRSQIFDYGTCQGFPQACGPVMVDGTLAGYMGTMIEDADPEQVVEANDLICQALAVLMRAAQRQKATGADTEQLTHFLQTGELAGLSEAVFMQQFPAPYRYAVLGAPAPAVSTLEYVSKSLNGTPGFWSCLAGESELLVLLFTPPDVREDAQWRTLRQLAETHRLAAGASDRFSSPLAVDTHRRQAMLALAHGYCGHGAQAQTFRALYAEILVTGAVERVGAERLLTPAARALFSDARSGADYRRTLEVYFENFCRSTTTAQALSVHKNTVLSRLERISDQLGIDLELPHERLSLALQLEVYRAAEGLRALQ